MPIPTELDSEDESDDKTYWPENTLSSENKSSRISESDVQEISAPIKNKKPKKKKPKVSFKMTPLHIC
jgi:hypothetical protein